MWNFSLAAAFLITITIIITIVIVTRRMRKNQRTNELRRRIKPSRTLAVLGSGGHTTEMIRLLSSLNKENFKPVYYVVASTDTTSLDRLYSICQSKGDANNRDANNSRNLEKPHHNEVFKIPRAREVGQSYFTSIFTALLSIVSSAHIILKTKPDILIINGPGTCLPIAFWTFIGRFVGICEGKIVFCESFCRVNTLSLTGKILVKFRMVDLFLVHWQELIDVISQQYSDEIKKGRIKFTLIDSFITNK